MYTVVDWRVQLFEREVFHQPHVFEREVDEKRKEYCHGASSPTGMNPCAFPSDRCHHNDTDVITTTTQTAVGVRIVINGGYRRDAAFPRCSHLFSDATACMQALKLIAERLEQLHSSGWVHRDLKPGNVLRLPNEHSWTLMDFGCAALSGAPLRPLSASAAVAGQPDYCQCYFG